MSVVAVLLLAFMVVGGVVVGRYVANRVNGQAVPGIGAALLIVSYGVAYAATKQLLGQGGSVLYWLTGNASFGAPPPSTTGSGGGGGAASATSGKAPGDGTQIAPGKKGKGVLLH